MVHGERGTFFAITAPGELGSREQLDLIEANYEAKVPCLGPYGTDGSFPSNFLSDTLNQFEAVGQSQLVCDLKGNPVAVSIIQQTPIPYSKIALLAYHIESKNSLKNSGFLHPIFSSEKTGWAICWSTNLCAQNTDKSLSVGMQTHGAFTELISGLSQAGGDLYNNCIRTWVYVRDIDVFYQGMVNERRALFFEQGLNGDSHFIASTGIEGICATLS